AARRNAYAVITKYIEAIDQLIERFALSSRIAPEPAILRDSIERDRELLPDVWQQNRRRDREEPVRLKLSFIRARLEATRTGIAERYAGHHEARPAAYPDAAAFAADLSVIEAALREAGAEVARRAHFEP